MNSYPLHISNATSDYSLSSFVIYLAAGTLAALCILVTIFILLYRRYQARQFEQSVIVSRRSYTFYEYNRPPRLQIVSPSYGAMTQTIRPQISAEKVSEWLRTRDKLLSKYAANDNIV